MPVLLGSEPCIDPLWTRQACAEATPSAPLDWIGKANAFTHPLGCEPGTGHVLLLRKQIDRLGINSINDLSFVSGNPRSSVVVKNVCIVTARCLLPADRGNEDTVFLCELADNRRTLQTMRIHKGYNVRKDITASTAGYFSDTLNGGSLWTWQTMVTDVWDTLGIADSSTLPFTPDGTPESFTFYGSSALEALQIILERISCALRLDPTTGVYSIIQLGASDTAAAARLTVLDAVRIWETEIEESAACTIPEQVAVHFPKIEQDAPETGCDVWYVVEKEDPNGTSSGVQAGTRAILYDDLHALYDSTPTLQNSAALDSRADDRAADYFRRVRQQRLARTYSGFWAGDVLPGPQIKVIRWEDLGDLEHGGFKTHLAWYPGTLLMQSLANGGNGKAVDSPECVWETEAHGGLWTKGGWHGDESQAWFSTTLAYFIPHIHCTLATFNGGFSATLSVDDETTTVTPCDSITFEGDYFTVTDLGSGDAKVDWDGVTVRKDGGSDVGTRPRLNFIEGSNVTLTIADDSGDNEIDITIAVTPSGSYSWDIEEDDLSPGFTVGSGDTVQLDAARFILTSPSANVYHIDINPAGVLLSFDVEDTVTAAIATITNGEAIIFEEEAFDVSDSAGNALVELSPYRAALVSTSDVSLGTGYTTIDVDSEHGAEGKPFYSALGGTGVVTVNKTGRYWLTYDVNVEAPSPGVVTDVKTAFFKNGAEDTNTNSEVSVGPDCPKNHLGCSTLMTLTAGDTVSVRGLKNPATDTVNARGSSMCRITAWFIGDS